MISSRMCRMAVLVLMAVPAVASAQQLPTMVGHFRPKVGDWAEYESLHEGGKHGPMKGRMRIAVVGREGDAYWIETRMAMESAGRHGGGDMISKALIAPGDGRSGVKRLILKSAMGIQELPVVTLPRHRPTRRPSWRAARSRSPCPPGRFGPGSSPTTESTPRFGRG